MRTRRAIAAVVVLAAAALTPAARSAAAPEPDGWTCNAMSTNPEADPTSAFQYCKDAQYFTSYRLKVWLNNPPMPTKIVYGTWSFPHSGCCNQGSYASWGDAWTIEKTRLIGQ